MSTHSDGLVLIWKIAQIEALNAGAEAIEPIHFFLGLLKAVDVDLRKLFSSSNKDEDKIQRIEEEIVEIKSWFEVASIDATRSRRRIRRELTDLSGPNETPNQTSLRRSQKSRILFAVAEKNDTKENTVTPKILLKAILNTTDDEMSRICYRAGCPLDTLSDALDQNLAKGDKEEVSILNARTNLEKKQKKQLPLLSSIGRDLTQLACDGKLGKLFGRTKEIREIIRTLIQTQKNNLILTGDAGVGKTMLVEGLAQKIASDDIPEQLKKCRIIEISMSSLVAGTSYRGEFEERIQRLIREAESDPNIILFFDEIHLMMGAGSASGSMDAANILKPALARGSIRVIGATTTAEYRKYIEKDPAVERRFQTIKLEEASKEETIEVLNGLKLKFETHHHVRIDDKALTSAVELSVRYLPLKRLPDKAIDLLDQACSRERLQTIAVDLKAKFKDGIVVNEQSVISVIAEKCGIPISVLTSEENNRLTDLENIIGKRVKGQPRAIKAVSNAIRVSRTGLKNPNKPVGIFLFTGPSGTGKTELAKSLAEALFNDEQRLIRFDMSEFMDEHSVTRLIGSPPGYKDHDRGGELTEKIRSTPYSVVLFDEIEKASPKVLDLFLQLFDEGHLSDAKGIKCDFRESVIIMTSNLGSGPRRKPLGFIIDDDVISEDRNKSVYEEIKKNLRPELINRISEIILFDPLGADAVYEIIDNHINVLEERLLKKGIIISADEDVVKLISTIADCESYGGRDIEKVIEKIIYQPLSDYILKNMGDGSNKIQITVGVKNEIEIKSGL